MKGLLLLRNSFHGAQNTGVCEWKLDKGLGLSGRFLFAQCHTDTQGSPAVAIPRACGFCPNDITPGIRRLSYILSFSSWKCWRNHKGGIPDLPGPAHNPLPRPPTAAPAWSSRELLPEACMPPTIAQHCAQGAV